ncbi:VOC family protein [Pseudonocardia lacus]|uniref:VOC family protein n=1 Tax=Pseudonocardia lacus TaxID=2835865 RepID=UPI0027E288F3|nr:VOC family protein [Pseudonocardia lacus]
MITAVHALVHAEDADAARTFFRDVLGFPAVDAGGGWLIFGTGPSELAAHPAGPPAPGAPARHEVTLMCDDVERTVAELTTRGARFTRPVRDDGWGLTISMEVPGAGEMTLYEPRHPVAYDG